MGFWSALSALAPIAPAEAEAQEIRRQRTMQDQAFQQQIQLGQARLQEEQQRIRAGNQIVPLSGSKSEWNPATGQFEQPALNPVTGKIESMGVPGVDPSAQAQQRARDVLGTYKALGIPVSPEMEDSIIAQSYGLKAPVGAAFKPLAGASGQPFKASDGKWYVKGYDPQGQIVTQPMGPDYTGPSMTPYQQAEVNLKKAEDALKDDPNSVPNKLAVMRARSEMTRDASYALRAQGQYLGTYNGKPLHGAVIDTQGKTVGSSLAGQYTKLESQIAQLTDAGGAIDQVNDALSGMYQSGASLQSPAVAAALANHTWTSAQVLQGLVAKDLTPQEQYAVVTIKSAEENIQGMRKAAGGGLSDTQVNRLVAQLPSAATPNPAYAKKQLQLLYNTLNRLAAGVPSTVGGSKREPAQGKGGLFPSGTVTDQQILDGLSKLGGK